MECQVCEFWRKIDTSEYPNEPDQGFCRLNPPTPVETLVPSNDPARKGLVPTYKILRLITAPNDECGMGEFVSIFLAKNKK